MVAANKKTKRVTYAIGAVAMLAVIGVVVALAVVLTGEESVAEPIISTTEGPTIPTPIVTVTTSTTTSSTTPSPVTPEEPTTLPDSGEINLEDFVTGGFASQSFNGTWVSGVCVFFNELFMCHSTNKTLTFFYLLIKLLVI